MRNPMKGRQPAATADAMPQSAELRRLRDERLRLAELVAERTWDLGGLTYEMAIRDHFRVDVLAKKAAELQEFESQLSEVERLMSHAEGVGGQCRYCGSPHARGAAYCWRCGHPLGTPQRAIAQPGSDAATAVLPTIDAEITAVRQPAPRRDDAGLS